MQVPVGQPIRSGPCGRHRNFAGRLMQDERADPLARRAPVGGVDLVGAAGAGLDFPWLVQQAGVAGQTSGSGLGQSCLDRLVASDGPGVVEPVPVDGAGARFLDKTRQNLRRLATAQDQPRPARLKVLGQRLQGLVQPPKRRPSLRSHALRLIEDVDRNNRSLDGHQGRIVGQPQILAQPEEGRGVLSWRTHAKRYADARCMDH